MLHTDRIKLLGESERFLAAGEWGRYASPVIRDIRKTFGVK
jgi:hypothetical protein